MKWKHMDEVTTITARDLSADDEASIEDVLDAAQAVADGAMPFYEAAAIGTLLDWRGHPSPPYTRYVAMHMARGDARWHALRQLVDTLVRKEGYVVTSQGVFRPEEIRANEASWQYADLGRDAA